MCTLPISLGCARRPVLSFAIPGAFVRPRAATCVPRWSRWKALLDSCPVAADLARREA